MWTLPQSLIIFVGLQFSDLVSAAPLRIHEGHAELWTSLSGEKYANINCEKMDFNFNESPCGLAEPSVVVGSSEKLNAAAISLHVFNNLHKEGILSPPMTQFDDQDEGELSPLVPRQFENTPSFDVGTPTATSRSHTTATTTSSANPYPYPLLPTSYTFPSYSYPDYNYPTYSFPDYTYPTYSFPDYTYPTYSYPDYTYPTYSFPDYTYPTYSYPTPTFDSGGSDSGFGGGGSSSTNFKLPKVRKVNVKTIVGAVVGSVSGVLALVGGIWAGMKRRARKALRMQQQQEQTREAEQRVPFMQGNSSGGTGSGDLGHTPSMSQMSSGGASTNNPHTPQMPPPPTPYVPTQF